MSQKDDLLRLIQEKKNQLASSSRGTEGWKTRKSQSIGSAQISKVSVLTLQKEIKELSEQIRNLAK
ncbi:hypothetical protein [Leucothrix mucor]|jgi:hypothetical protein|uniref:hypothetical protein n=1 Tax=Leucothrix mucor TaxID=45248 RepID=UPI0003B685FB|nr:hypothetical protein [Leucothrix mucor]